MSVIVKTIIWDMSSEGSEKNMMGQTWNLMITINWIIHWKLCHVFGTSMMKFKWKLKIQNWHVNWINNSKLTIVWMFYEFKNNDLGRLKFVFWVTSQLFGWFFLSYFIFWGCDLDNFNGNDRGASFSFGKKLHTDFTNISLTPMICNKK